MRKLGLIVMLMAMLAVPMLACGFPLPAGTSMMAVSKAVCGEGEAPETCQARQDAYQMMSKLNSAVVPDMAMGLNMSLEGQAMDVSITGHYEYVVLQDSMGMGAAVHAWIDDGTMVQDGETTTFSGAEIIIIDNMGYVTEDGGETWTGEELDEDTFNGLRLILGLAGPTGADADLFSDPASFSVTVSDAGEYNGQSMVSQVLSLDFAALMANPDALGALAGDAEGAAGQSFGAEELDMEQLADPMVMGMLMMFMAGTEFSTTIYIGADDGLIHYIEENHVFNLDAGEDFNAEFGGPITMSYTLSGHIEQHNAELVIEPPAEWTTAEGEFGSLFGGDAGLLGRESGLGEGLFGQ